MDLNNTLDKFKKPDVNEAIAFLQRFVKEEMDGVANDIVIQAVDHDEEEQIHSELESLKIAEQELNLLYAFKKLVKETKYCSFKLYCPTGSFNWHISDTVPGHINYTVKGNNLTECLRKVIDVIMANREAMAGSTAYRFQMKCPSNSNEYTDLARKLDRTVEL